MNRINDKNITSLADNKAFEKLVDQIAATQLILEDIKTTHNLQKQEKEKTFKSKVAMLEGKLNEKFAIANMYAINNREEILGSAKSKKSKRSVFGFRKASGALKFLKDWSESRTIDALKKSGLHGLLKKVEKLDKALTKSTLHETQLQEHGLYIDRADKFYIEPTRDEALKGERIAS